MVSKSVLPFSFDSFSARAVLDPRVRNVKVNLLKILSPDLCL